MLLPSSITKSQFLLTALFPIFLNCRVWSSREGENAPQHSPSLHCGSQHEGCQMCRLLGHCAFWTPGCHLSGFVSSVYRERRVVFQQGIYWLLLSKLLTIHRIISHGRFWGCNRAYLENMLVSQKKCSRIYRGKSL